MGQAKARGTFEQRKALAERRRQEREAAVIEAENARRAKAAERKALMTKEERKEALMVAGSSAIGRAELAALLGIAMGAAAPLIVVDRERK